MSHFHLIPDKHIVSQITEYGVLCLFVLYSSPYRVLSSIARLQSVSLHSFSDSAGGQPFPSPGSAVLHNIEDWKDVVKFPDLDAYDWEEESRIQLANVDRDTQILDYSSWNAQFLCATHLMGFMDGLCAFAEEPEICKVLVDAISDYKIRILERVQKYFKPDFFTTFDDVATQSSLFLSPETYREIIKPAHKKVNDAAKAMGMYPKMHTCGYCEALIPDFIDEGNVA